MPATWARSLSAATSWAAASSASLRVSIDARGEDKGDEEEGNEEDKDGGKRVANLCTAVVEGVPKVSPPLFPLEALNGADSRAPLLGVDKLEN